LTIAHRLETIADYDMIVVMDSGQMVEQGSPSELIDINSPCKYFKELVRELGPETRSRFFRNLQQKKGIL
jgi:ATP-binding cassette subfamily C (CFTR/MRP) protein 4